MGKDVMGKDIMGKGAMEDPDVLLPATTAIGGVQVGLCASRYSVAVMPVTFLKMRQK